MAKEENQVFKIITLGESGVGKTSIINRFTKNEFYENISSTIGINFSNKEMIINNKHKIILRIIDTAGQERFRSLSKSYYKNVDVVLFVFSMNDKESFEKITEWMESFKENNNKGGDIPKYLVGNKNDLELKVEQNLIDEFIKEKKIPFISTSAKGNICINKLFEDIGKKIFEDYINKGVKTQKNINITFKAENKSKCCLNNINLR